MKPYQIRTFGDLVHRGVHAVVPGFIKYPVQKWNHRRIKESREAAAAALDAK